MSEQLLMSAIIMETLSTELRSISWPNYREYTVTLMLSLSALKFVAAVKEDAYT